MNNLACFLRDTNGAVTVDWVVLTAVTVGFGLMVLATLSSGTLDIAQELEAALAQAEVALNVDESAPIVAPVPGVALSP